MKNARSKVQNLPAGTRSKLCLQRKVAGLLRASFFKCNSLALHRVIFALGVSMMILNVPVEWLSLGSEWTWMLLFEDVQQGVFYSTLFCFWIIFCGEHLMVSTFFTFSPYTVLFSPYIHPNFIQQQTL